MQEIRIEKAQAGQRFDKFLQKYFKEAGTGFLYKMLRKKNITLNGRKSEGRELLKEGDRVQTYFSEETFQKLRESPDKADTAPYLAAFHTLQGVEVLYEDEDMAALNKPVGVLSQKAKADDLSLNEWLIGFLLESGQILETSLSEFRPSVCNRLDRNTSGIVLCAKTLKGAQMLGKGIRERSIHKYYHTICCGKISRDATLSGYLRKDPNTNKVDVIPVKKDGYDEIYTCYHPIESTEAFTHLEILLITGKPHQIRAHLASIGHPVLGDIKYGFRRDGKHSFQLLHAGKVVFPDGPTILAPLPEAFKKALKDCGFKDERG